MPKKATFYKKTHNSAPKIFNVNEDDNEKEITKTITICEKGNEKWQRKRKR